MMTLSPSHAFRRWGMSDARHAIWGFVQATFDAPMPVLRMTGLDEFFPGSKTRRDAPPPPAKPALPEDVEGWDDNPTVMTLNGVETEFYTIGALAKAMNRQVVTIRKWERLGYMPKATYRTAGGRKDRLYTRAQIEGLVILAMEEGIYELNSRTPIDATNFPSRATQLFLALAG